MVGYEGVQAGLGGNTTELKRPRECSPASIPPSSPQAQSVDALASDNRSRACGEGTFPLQSGPVQATALHEQQLSIHQETRADEEVGGQSKKARLLSPVSPEMSMMPQFSPITPIIENQGGGMPTQEHAGSVYTPQANLDGSSMSSHTAVGLASSPFLVKSELSHQLSPDNSILRASEETATSSSASSSLLPPSSSERIPPPGDLVISTGSSEILREDFASPLLSRQFLPSQELPGSEEDLLSSSSSRTSALDGRLMPQAMAGRGSPSRTSVSSFSLVKRQSAQDTEEGSTTSERRDQTGDAAAAPPSLLPSLQPSPFQPALSTPEISVKEEIQEER